MCCLAATSVKPQVNSNANTTITVRNPAMPTFGQPRVLKLPMNGLYIYVFRYYFILAVKSIGSGGAMPKGIQIITQKPGSSAAVKQFSLANGMIARQINIANLSDAFKSTTDSKNLNATAAETTKSTTSVHSIDTPKSTIDIAANVTADTATVAVDTTPSMEHDATETTIKNEPISLSPQTSTDKQQSMKDEPRKESSTGRRTLQSVLEALNKQQELQQQQEHEKLYDSQLTTMRPPPPVMKNYTTKEQLTMCGRCAADLPVLRR